MISLSDQHFMVSVILILAISEGNSIPGLGRSAGEGIGYPLQYTWASLEAQLVKNPPAMRETWVWSLSWEDPLEKEKATHFSILAWRIPWTVQSMGSQRVRQDWVTFTWLHFWWCRVIFHYGFNLISFWLMMLSFLIWPYFQLCIFPLWHSYLSLLLILWLLHFSVCMHVIFCLSEIKYPKIDRQLVKKQEYWKFKIECG